MTYIRVTTREKDLLESLVRFPANAPVAAPWLPRKKIDDAYRVLDYTAQRVEPPAGSPLGALSVGVTSAMNETNRPIMSFRQTYTVNKTDLRIALREGRNPVAQNMNMMRQSFEENILRLFFQGTHGTEWLPDISGALAVGEDTDATLDAVYWATATSPVTHAAAGYADLLANNYFGPFDWILSWSLAAGMQALNNAANPRTHEEIIRAGYVKGDIYYYPNGTSAFGTGGYTTYPLPAASADGTGDTPTDDGLWLMIARKNAAGEDNFYMAEVTNGVETRVADMLDENNNYVYEMEWRGTPVFRGATTGSAGSAPYIVYEPQADLAS